ncbi:MAG: hemolysin family protein [Eubacteriales bacterium]
MFIAFIFCVVCAAYFSGAESAYAAANKIRIKNAAEDGDKRAQRALFITNNFDRALTTILIGTNVMHIGCSSIATLFATQLWGESAVIYATLVTTVIVFFVSEMIPKSYAKANSTKVSLEIASSLRVLMKLLAPAAYFFMGISRLVTRLFKKENTPTVTEDELSTIIETVEEEGGMSEGQSELLQSAMEFPTTRVSDVLTARGDIVAVDADMESGAVLQLIRAAKHSRLPVYEGNLDNIIGVLSVRKFLKETIRQGTADVRALMAPPFFVSPDAEIGDLLSRMTQNRICLAVVKDGSDHTLGLITVEDFLEELVGEIWDEDDVVDASFIKLGGNRFRVSGTMNTGEAFARMGFVCTDKTVTAKQVQAWAIECFGHVPEEEEECGFRTLLLTVDEMENGRIKTLDIKMNTETPSDAVPRTPELSHTEVN